MAQDNNTSAQKRDPFSAWRRFTTSLETAGATLEAATTDYSDDERADAVRALHRAVTNQLDRLEVDDASPEMLAFNGWRQKFFMDNPDCGYFLADICDDGRYRISGNVGASVFTSVTVYAGAGLNTAAVSRTTSDEFDIDDVGTFDITLGGDDSDLGLPVGSNIVWVRHFYEADAEQSDLGTATIERLDDVEIPPGVDEAIGKRLIRAGQTIELIASVIGSTEANEQPHGFNTVRHWEQMAGGAVYTEPGISYLRGSWCLETGESLVVELDIPDCRHWSFLLYSRHLNSLDARNRTVSLTGTTAVRGADGRCRVVIGAREPGMNDVGIDNFLDTEGRRFGVFVIRALQPTGPVEVPATTVVRTAEEGSR